MTTFMLSLFNIGLWKFGGKAGSSLDGAISLAFIYGGVAQFAAGMWEFARKNTFGALAFTSYGAFWIGIYFFINFQQGLAVEGALGVYLLAWTIFTAYMLIASMKTNPFFLRPSSIALASCLTCSSRWALTRVSRNAFLSAPGKAATLASITRRLTGSFRIGAPDPR